MSGDERSMSFQCMKCGTNVGPINFPAGEAVDALGRLDAVHDLLRPTCPEAVARVPSAGVQGGDGRG